MKKSELFKIFKEYFDTELKQMIRAVVNEELNKGTKAIKLNSSTSLSEMLNDFDLTTEISHKKIIKKPVQPVKLFKSDNLLGDILNETAASVITPTEEDDGSDWPVFDKRLFTSKATQANDKRIAQSDDSKLTELEIQQKRDMRAKYMSELGKMGVNTSHQIPGGGGGVASVQEMMPDDLKGTIVPPELADALTKDYSQIVKSFKKKK